MWNGRRHCCPRLLPPFAAPAVVAWRYGYVLPCRTIGDFPWRNRKRNCSTFMPIGWRWSVISRCFLFLSNWKSRYWCKSAVWRWMILLIITPTLSLSVWNSRLLCRVRRPSGNGNRGRRILCWGWSLATSLHGLLRKCLRLLWIVRSKRWRTGDVATTCNPCLCILPNIASRRVFPRKRLCGRRLSTIIGRRMSRPSVWNCIIFIRNVRGLVRKAVWPGSRRWLFYSKSLWTVVMNSVITQFWMIWNTDSVIPSISVSDLWTDVSVTVCPSVPWKRVSVCGTVMWTVSWIRNTFLCIIPLRSIFMIQAVGTGRTVSVHWPVLFLVTIRTGGNCSTAGFSAWWLIGADSTASMVIILPLYLLVRRVSVSQRFAAFFCLRNSASAIRTASTSKANRKPNAIWDVFS